MKRTLTQIRAAAGIRLPNGSSQDWISLGDSKNRSISMELTKEGLVVIRDAKFPNTEVVVPSAAILYMWFDVAEEPNKEVSTSSTPEDTTSVELPRKPGRPAKG